MSAVQIQKENPTEVGLPNRVGGAIGIRDGNAMADGAQDLDLPDDPEAARWFEIGVLHGRISALERFLGLTREVHHADLG
ncbi:hypothetical protein Talka_00419 [Tepidimonas alkaliphilus]|uniref:Uncharacterized protein n=1 Tax=Tepidimonas alkaliphilus TaxID=2588942 RepID=A0A554WB21_9BURK|nr:hypothetical protein [Tepidimonas alkaliphilus]TSE20756.1 hypothetical protein Talka_00419 [Tepidimonas alkaliphilus]